MNRPTERMSEIRVASKPQRERVACPLCGSHEQRVMLRPWREVDDPVQLYGSANGIQGAQTLVRCERCRFLFESPRFAERVILQGYREADATRHDSQYPFRVRGFARALTKLKRHLPPTGARILDVGCAGGAFLEAAQSLGYQATGLEPSPALVEHGRARGLDIRPGTATEHGLKDECFDMICLWDVLEHIADPKHALASLSMLLEPKGVLLINFPDIGTWQAKLAGKRYWWIISVHLHHFSRGSSRLLCRETGFEVFLFKRYWQTIELGYLQTMAIHYGLPLSRLFHKLTPAMLRRLPISYYAGQTTALARRRS